MSADTIRGSAISDFRYRMPEMPRCYSGETDVLQRLFAVAYLQTQKASEETEEERQKEADCLSAINATQQRTLEANLSFEQYLGFIVDQARCITGANGAAIALRDGADFICRGRSGVLVPDLGTKVDPHSGISGACLRTGEIQQCDETESDSR